MLGFEIPFWPPFCAVKMVDSDTCTFLGLTIPCMATFSDQTLEYFGYNFEASHIWTFFLTVVIGCINISYTGTFLYHWKNSMAITMGLYAIITGIFSLLRFYWGISKPLLVNAALHNLIEWAIVVQIASGSSNIIKLGLGMTYAIVFTSVVISVGLMIPHLYFAFGSAQAAGLILDVGIPILVVPKWLFSDDKEIREFYRLPSLAHMIHLLFTILPLALAIFFENNPSWFTDFVLEVFIMLSVPVTHLLYCIWSWDYDRLAWKDYKDDDINSFPSKEFKKYQIMNVRKTLIISFFLGLLPLLALPSLMGRCPVNGPQCSIANKSITQTRVAEVRPGYLLAFEGIFTSKNFVETARSAPGNIDYQIIQSVDKKNEYMLIEKWDSFSSQKNWEASTNASLLDSPEMKSLLVHGGWSIGGAFTELTDDGCRSTETGVLVFDVENTCSGVWKWIRDQGSCFWVPGCVFAPFQSNADAGTPVRLLHMDDSRKVMANFFHGHNENTVSYEIRQDEVLKGYLGTLALADAHEADKCTVAIQYSVHPESHLPISHIEEAFKKSIQTWQLLLTKKRGIFSRGREELLPPRGTSSISLAMSQS